MELWFLLTTLIFLYAFSDDIAVRLAHKKVKRSMKKAERKRKKEDKVNADNV